MRLIERLQQWWKQLTDPTERALRKEQKKAAKMARFLEQNQQAAKGGDEA